jgi:hypothetical protein
VRAGKILRVPRQLIDVEKFRTKRRFIGRIIKTILPVRPIPADQPFQALRDSGKLDRQSLTLSFVRRKKEGRISATLFYPVRSG